MQLLSEFLHGTINNWKYTRYRNDISNPIFFILELDGNRNFRLKESARYLYFLFIYIFFLRKCILRILSLSRE